MKIDISLLTGIIYARDKNKKEDVTEQCISAVGIFLAEGFENNYILHSKMDGKRYKLKLEEVDK